MTVELDRAEGVRICWDAMTQAWAPPPPMTVSEWADAHGKITPGMSGLPGTQDWRTRAPQRAILDAFGHPQVRHVRVKKSARIGWSSMLQMVMGYWCHYSPRTILAVQPTEGDADEWSKEVIDPMLEETDVLRPLFLDPSVRAESTISQKYYTGGLSIRLRGAQTGRGFRRFTAGGVLLDEVDAYPETAGDEGDQIKLAERRAETFYDAVIACGSTPLLKGFSRIEALMEDASRGYYVLTCPHASCQTEHIRMFRQPETLPVLRGEEMPVSHLFWPDGKPEEAYWVCPGCSNPITHAYHPDMLDAGYWKGQDWLWTHEEGFTFDPTFRGIIGFVIWSGYSQTTSATPQSLAQEWMTSKGRPDTRQVFINTVLGETYESSGDQPKPLGLMKRREDWGDLDIPIVPEFLTCFVDIQGTWFELEFVAWGKGRESWSVEYLILPGGPDDDDSWLDVQKAIDTTFTTPDGERRVDAVGIDVGFRQDRAMTFIKHQTGGRVLPFKGSSQSGSAIVESLHDRIKRLRRLRHKGEQLRPVMIGPDAAKRTVYSMLHIEKHGPGYCHFPHDRPQEYFDSLTAERMIVKYNKGFPKREWHKMRERNEALDCRVGNLALCVLMEQKVIRPHVTGSAGPHKPRAPAQQQTTAETYQQVPQRPPGRGLGKAGWNLRRRF